VTGDERIRALVEIPKGSRNKALELIEDCRQRYKEG